MAARNDQDFELAVLKPAPRIAILKSRFNAVVTDGLLKGAVDTLEALGVQPEIISAPGAFELPLMAQTLAKTGLYEGIIALGCVVKGDTAHFEYINMGTTVGLMQAQLETKVPMAFGVLTVYQQDQALARSSDDKENKGIEAAKACYEAVAFQRRIAKF